MDFVRSPRTTSTFYSQVSFEWSLVISGFWTEAMESVSCPELATWGPCASFQIRLLKGRCTALKEHSDCWWRMWLSFYHLVFLVCFGYSCALHYCPLQYCLVNYWSFSFLCFSKYCFSTSLAKLSDDSLLTSFSSKFLVWYLTDRWLWGGQIKLNCVLGPLNNWGLKTQFLSWFKRAVMTEAAYMLNTS